MEKQRTNDKNLHLVFEKLKQEDLPAGFQQQVMQKIAKAQARQERRNVGIVIFVSVCLSAGALYLLTHYLSFSFAQLYKTIFENTSISTSSSTVFFTMIGIAAGILLTGDYYLRRYIQKNGARYGETPETT